MKQRQSDYSQKLSVYSGFIFEFYRAIMAAFLISFVPQQCGDEVCGLVDNTYTGKGELYDTATSLNIVTFLSFICLYYVEIKRENKMIDYLEINRELPKDNESVGEALIQLPDVVVSELHLLDHRYQLCAYAAAILFIINTSVSAVPIIQNRIDSKTFTVLLTNVLFVVSKFQEVYEIVQTKENVFLSAYLTERQQFNDIDPDVIEVSAVHIDLNEETKEVDTQDVSIPTV